MLVVMGPGVRRDDIEIGAASDSIQLKGSPGLTMGRFATTVALYEELRPPYPPSFFREVAQRFAFGKQHALIDLGTGPGLLALGFDWSLFQRGIAASFEGIKR